ncbi:MAG: tRNA (adenosine(37)-N6)-threonylcarbamoyltransferase complex dimerization subunit type 1 TsaB [Flavobacteriales bacterium]|nr:tRNA (adenosine(37)-N6)-threonylcarbamoyltransferase complex dimerization subunit type 1 TsaB [Flavobacteriales bacterium]
MSNFLLHIETCTKMCSVALSENGKLLDCIENDADNYIHGEYLTVYIEEILAKNKLTPSLLSAVSFSSGPGSYTGLRIGLSVAKGLCFALSIPLISVSTLKVLASLGKEKYPGSTLVPMIDARRNEVYCEIFNPELKSIKPLSADILDETSYQNFEPFVCFGDGAEKMSNQWEHRKITFDTSIKLSAKGQVAQAYEKFIKNEFEDVAYFTPLYLKEFVTGGGN